MNKTPYIVVIVILSILTVAFFIWALVTQASLNSRAATIVENPYCLRVACYSGEQPQAFNIPIADDPQRTGYQTMNYCVNNAPPSAFTSAMQICSFTNDAEARRLLKEFFAWYPTNYLPTCGNGWKTETNIPLATQAIPGQTVNPIVLDVNNPSNPNNPLTLNGLNDPSATAAYCCANKLPGFIDEMKADNPAAYAGYEIISGLLKGTSPCSSSSS